MEIGLVSIVIPNWNGSSLLSSCLQSIRSQSFSSVEVIVVDNGSTDGSVELVRSHFAYVKTIPVEVNRGFAFAVNAGIRESNGEFIALVNNDVELDSGWVAAMVDAMRRHADAGSVACKMLRQDSRSTIDAVGDGLTRGGSPLTLGSGEEDRGQFDREGAAFGACAGAALYRTSMLDRIGHFDESFVSYYEDADLSFRAQLAGFQCVYTPRAVCYHKRGATAKNLRNDYPVRMQERNLTGFQIKNFPAGVLMRRLFSILGSRVRRLLRLTLAGSGRAAWSGLFEGLGLIPEMIRARGQVQKQKTVSNEYLISFMGKSFSSS